MTSAIAPIQEAVAGDQRCCMEWLEPLLPDAYRLAVVLLKTRSEAEDAVQDAALKAWQSFGRFRRDSPLRPWLFTIVANECRRQRRSPWWKVIKRPEPVEAPAPNTPNDSAAEDLRFALYQLPHDQRLAVILRYYMDLPFKEVAQTLGIS